MTRNFELLHYKDLIWDFIAKKTNHWSFLCNKTFRPVDNFNKIQICIMGDLCKIRFWPLQTNTRDNCFTALAHFLNDLHLLHHWYFLAQMNSMKLYFTIWGVWPWFGLNLSIILVKSYTRQTKASPPRINDVHILE